MYQQDVRGMVASHQVNHFPQTAGLGPCIRAKNAPGTPGSPGARVQASHEKQDLKLFFLHACIIHISFYTLETGGWGLHGC